MSAERLGWFPRKVLRAPVWLYAHGLGRLLGRRFLCLAHVGRRSGRTYRTVLEVIGHDPASGEYLVIAGFGPGADWYRNIQATPAVEVVVGTDRFAPEQRVLTEADAVRAFAGYEHRNRWIRPILRPILGKLLGWPYDGSDTARHQLARQLPIVAFRPR